MEKIIRYACIGSFIIAAIIASISLPRRELQRIAQVAGIAIDGKEGEIVATFELFEPSVDQPYGKERTATTSRGETLEECIENARLSIGKELYVDDISILIVGDEEVEFLLAEVKRYYSRYKQDHMDLPLIRAKNQKAAEVFQGKGKILSTEIAESLRFLGKRPTIKDLFNGVQPDVYIKGVGNYEIIS